MQEVGKKKSKRILAAALAGGLFLAGAGTAAAAISYPGSATVGELSGSTEGPIHVKSADGVELKSRSGTNVATWELTYAPEREADWHSHPGIIIAVVKEGTVTRQVALGNGKCIEETFTKGDAFTEVEPHKVKNPSTTEAAVLSITAIHATDSEELTTPQDITCK